MLDHLMKMNPAYFETHFRRQTSWDDWPHEFAIITAYATTGETWTDLRNRDADQMLEAEFRKRSTWVRRLTGYSPTSDHSEPGWAVATGFEEACDIGQKYRQDAIYFVCDNALSVSFCNELRKPVEVGLFRERVHELPRRLE